MRKTFFSFHFGRDAWRAGQIRNSGMFLGERAGFLDKAQWEKVKLRGKVAINRWIDEQLLGTSVTVVLIGKETSERDYVNYEMLKSYEKGNGMIGIYIHNVRDRYGITDNKGKNPFDNYSIVQGGRKVCFSELYSTYDWVNDLGRENLGKWIEKAALKAGR